MITLLILIPVLGSLLLIPISSSSSTPQETQTPQESQTQSSSYFSTLNLNLKLKEQESNNNKMRRIALTTSLINLKLFVSLFIFLFLIDIFFYIYELYSEVNNIYFLNILPQGESNYSVPMDPPRWWPSGVPQGWAIVGSALTIFLFLSKIPGVTPRGRVLGALASGGVSASQISYNSAIENSLGFNRLMWGFSEIRRTGVWPSIEQISKTTTEKQITDFANAAMKHSDQSKVDVVVKEVVYNFNKFLPSPDLDFSNFIEKFSHLIFKETMQLLKPVQIQGFFDDLIGQRMFIEIILFITTICLILLFIIFIFNLIFLLNKDKIIKKFNNKFIRFYIKYQTALSWITLLYVPIFIFMGLFTLFNGILWLITHQIPYESLGIDLHQFISSSSPLPYPLPLQGGENGGTDIVAS
uniref:LAGLIDADG homing endonuclease n=1 Tax=Termitomyces sp. TaxID=1916073 RepID=A0A3G2BS39_9AGAR|nr:hypothetical protein DXG00_000016 [Termitomyces sp.]